MKYGEKLKIAREFLELTQEQAALILGMTRNQIVNIENNKRSVKSDELYKFSKLYGISMEEIVSNQEIDVNDIMFEKRFKMLNEKDKKEVINLVNFKIKNKENLNEKV